MTAHEFGMWGFSVLVWIFTGLSAWWGFHLVFTAIHNMKVQQFMNEVFVQDVIEEGVEFIEVDPEEDEDDFN